MQKKDELKTELTWAVGRPKARGPSLPIEHNDAFVNALTEEEYKAMQGYEKIAPGCTVSLAQRPNKRAMRSTEAVLHTIVKKTCTFF